ncbi:MAG: [FeFe] hydrogenase H-cluster radical SAM maturase HydE [Candidatus Eisenbacteria bacterium]|nr:[FeFe] hydrogenase H-cluster radical SAM maturase HydE [Candidatus Eisenbacteria bacterium]
MDRSTICSWLTERDPARLQALWDWADRVRASGVGDAVHLRGLIEVSNYCVRDCSYCGLRRPRGGLPRYRLSEEEVMQAVRRAVEWGFGTVVLQSGEDPGLEAGWMRSLVTRIKKETSLAITLSLGERRRDELAAWRDSGADRYLLKFETSNRELYRRIHPERADEPGRLSLLAHLRDLGYEVGSGVMVGIPGQTFDDLSRDIELFGELDLDMISVGPFIPHPATPLGHEVLSANGVPGGSEVALAAMALTRIKCPRANIPTTTALSTLDVGAGLERGLNVGANVVMPNLTPPPYRQLYQVYPGKGGNGEDPTTEPRRIIERIRALGRCIGDGRGDAPKSWAPAAAALVAEVRT